MAVDQDSFLLLFSKKQPACLSACCAPVVTALALTLEGVGNIRKLSISLQLLYLGRIQFFFQ